jgi:hypothetical protein
MSKKTGMDSFNLQTLFFIMLSIFLSLLFFLSLVFLYLFLAIFLCFPFLSLPHCHQALPSFVRLECPLNRTTVDLTTVKELLASAVKACGSRLPLAATASLVEGGSEYWPITVAARSNA